MNHSASSPLVTAGFVLVTLYAAAILFFVIRGARKTRSVQDYARGSIAFSPSLVGLSLAASMTSAATFVINPGLIAMYGVSGVISYGVVLPVAALLSLIVLTKAFRKRGTSVDAATMSQWLEARYGSKTYALFFGFLSLLLLTFVVLICVGLTKVLSKTLDISELTALLGVVIFVFGYMMFGGANSLVYTNAIQAILMAVVACMLLGSGYEHFSHGVGSLLDELSAIDPNLTSLTHPQSFLFRDGFEIVICQLIVGAAVVCQPHIITKSLLLKSDRDVNRYLTVAVAAEVLFFAVVIVGLYARLTFPDMTVDGTPLAVDGIVSAYVVRAFPVYAAIVVVLGLLSAGLSTLEGLIQSMGSTLTSDVIAPLAGRLLPSEQGRRDRALVRVNRGVIALVGVLAAVLSYQQLVNPDVSVAVFAQNGVYAYFAAAFVPVLFGSFFRTVPVAAPVAASVTAVLVHFGIYYGRLTPYMHSGTRNPGVAAAIAIFASLLAGVAVLALSRGLEKRRQQRTAEAAG